MPANSRWDLIRRLRVNLDTQNKHRSCPCSSFYAGSHSSFPVCHWHCLDVPQSAPCGGHCAMCRFSRLCCWRFESSEDSSLQQRRILIFHGFFFNIAVRLSTHRNCKAEINAFFRLLRPNR